jgi:hypothetical protein
MYQCAFNSFSLFKAILRFWFCLNYAVLALRPPLKCHSNRKRCFQTIKEHLSSTSLSKNKYRKQAYDNHRYVRAGCRGRTFQVVAVEGLFEHCYGLHLIVPTSHVIAELLTSRTDYSADMQPIVDIQLDLDFLAKVEAGERVILNLQMQPTVFARKLITA